MLPAELSFTHATALAINKCFHALRPCSGYRNSFFYWCQIIAHTFMISALLCKSQFLLLIFKKQFALTSKDQYNRGMVKQKMLERR